MSKHPAVPDFVTESRKDKSLQTPDVERAGTHNTTSTSPADYVKDLPLEWLLSPGKSKKSRIDRILAGLLLKESREPKPHFKDDYRQTWCAIYLADAKKEFFDGRDAFMAASLRMYGLRPDQVWPKLVARRKADLGPEYSRFYDENDNYRLSNTCADPFEMQRILVRPSDSPKKPIQSAVRLEANKEEKA